MPFERVIPLAILALSSIACLVFGAQWFVAVIRRSHTSFAIERADAGQRANTAGLRFGVSLACVLASTALVVATGAAQGSNPSAAPAADAASQVIYYVTTAATRPADPAAGTAPPTTAPVPTRSAEPAPTGTPLAQPLPTPTLRATVAPTATPAPARPPGPTPTRPAATPVPTPTQARAVSLPAPDCADPGTVGILSPTHGETVSSRRSIIANAGVLPGEFVKFEVLNDAGTWAFLGRTDTGIRNGAIAQFDPAQFPSGPRQIRLMLVDRDQHEAKLCRIAIVIP